MKKELSLSEIKSCAFDILKHFASFCATHNLRFYLSNGTLLGAVKYGGFIPWDDDIDVFVPREDYDRLIKIYQSSDKYKLFSQETTPAYRFPFAKLCDMTTRKIETGVNNGVDLGIDIDIFPLDSCSEHILKPGVQRRIKIFLVGCMLSKFTSSVDRPFYKRFVIGCCRFVGFKFFCKRLTKRIAKERALGDDCMGCLIWPIYGEREIIPAKVFSDTEVVEFEGEKFNAPIGYDAYLRSLYGDYEKDPPPEKQKSHHRYTAYRID